MRIEEKMATDEQSKHDAFNLTMRLLETLIENIPTKTAKKFLEDELVTVRREYEKWIEGQLEK